jgi:hypothetical protein
VVFDGEHWAYPQIAGRQVFGNPMQAGWAKAGSFADPREHPFGPLPRDWAHWRGLYLHGDKVVLSYSVGGAEVLELPGLERRGDLTAFSRAIERGPAVEPQDLQVAFEAGRHVALWVRDPLQPPPIANETTALLERREEVIATAMVGAPAGARWITEAEGHLRLRLPPAEEPTRFKILLWRGARGRWRTSRNWSTFRRAGRTSSRGRAAARRVGRTDW